MPKAPHETFDKCAASGAWRGKAALTKHKQQVFSFCGQLVVGIVAKDCAIPLQEWRSYPHGSGKLNYVSFASRFTSDLKASHRKVPGKADLRVNAAVLEGWICLLAVASF